MEKYLNRLENYKKMRQNIIIDFDKNFRKIVNEFFKKSQKIDSISWEHMWLSKNYEDFDIPNSTFDVSLVVCTINGFDLTVDASCLPFLQEYAFDSITNEEELLTHNKYVKDNKIKNRKTHIGGKGFVKQSGFISEEMENLKTFINTLISLPADMMVEIYGIGTITAHRNGDIESEELFGIEDDDEDEYGDDYEDYEYQNNLNETNNPQLEKIKNDIYEKSGINIGDAFVWEGKDIYLLQREKDVLTICDRYLFASEPFHQIALLMESNTGIKIIEKGKFEILFKELIYNLEIDKYWNYK